MDQVVDLNGKDGIEKISALIKRVHICMLTTAAADGSFDSRPMATQDIDFGGTVWFLIRGDSGMAAEIAQDTHVSLIYASPSDSTYVVAKGRAKISKDRVKIEGLWSSIYRAWFPEGSSDPSIAVLRVDVTEAQYWEASSHKLVNGAKYLAAAITGGMVAVGETGKVTI